MSKIIIKQRVIMVFSFLMVLNYSCFQKHNHIDSKNEAKIITDFVDNEMVSFDFIGINNLIELLGKTIDSLPDITGYDREKIAIEDEYEDELISWNGVKYVKNNVLIFIVETNWINKSIVDRITIFSDQIKEGKLYVGQIVGNVKDMIEDKIPTSSDGELFVKLKKYSEVVLKLDISNIPLSSPLYYGVSTLSEIPDSLKIESIVIIEK